MVIHCDRREAASAICKKSFQKVDSNKQQLKILSNNINRTGYEYFEIRVSLFDFVHPRNGV